jgi:hypothetical protein
MFKSSVDTITFIVSNVCILFGVSPQHWNDISQYNIIVLSYPHGEAIVVVGVFERYREQRAERYITEAIAAQQKFWSHNA